MPVIADLDTPAVLIDIDRVEANLQRAQAHARANGYRLRPHIKTHKLPRFALRQIELGAAGITAQKLGEAEVMADAGVRNIFLPYNILGEHKLARLKALNARITLAVTADSSETIRGYAATFGPEWPLRVLVECDTGGARCGVQDPLQAAALALEISMAPGLRFGGLMTYPRPNSVAQTNAWLAEAIGFLGDVGLSAATVSSGNTPDMWAEGAGPVTERRPGTYIYFDRTQVRMGVAGLEDCALTVLATVVSRPTPTRVIVDAGSKALSSDVLGNDGHGLIVGTDLVLKTLNEEHGIIEMPTPSAWPPIGERLRIIPNHACVVSNLFDEVHLVSGETVTETVPVAARGRVG